MERKRNPIRKAAGGHTNTKNRYANWSLNWQSLEDACGVRCRQLLQSFHPMWPSPSQTSNRGETFLFLLNFLKLTSHSMCTILFVTPRRSGSIIWRARMVPPLRRFISIKGFKIRPPIVFRGKYRERLCTVLRDPATSMKIESRQNKKDDRRNVYILI